MRIAVYAGTFDPVTFGHLSVIERAARWFDQLHVLVAINPDKQPLFSVAERLQLLRELSAAWPNVECASTTGFVVDFARARQARYLVRGVRGATDIEAEIALSHLNRQLAAEVETVFVPAHPELSEVSSSRLKQWVSEGRDVSVYCPATVAQHLRARLTPAAPQEEHPV